MRFRLINFITEGKLLTLNMNQDEVNYEVLKETQINILAFLFCLNFLSFFIWRLRTGFYIS